MFHEYQFNAIMFLVIEFPMYIIWLLVKPLFLWLETYSIQLEINNWFIYQEVLLIKLIICRHGSIYKKKNWRYRSKLEVHITRNWINWIPAQQASSCRMAAKFNSSHNITPISLCGLCPILLCLHSE